MYIFIYIYKYIILYNMSKPLQDIVILDEMTRLWKHNLQTLQSLLFSMVIDGNLSGKASACLVSLAMLEPWGIDTQSLKEFAHEPSWSSWEVSRRWEVAYDACVDEWLTCDHWIRAWMTVGKIWCFYEDSISRKGFPHNLAKIAPLPVLCITRLKADRDQTSLTSRTNAQLGRGMPGVVLIPKPAV